MTAFNLVPGMGTLQHILSRHPLPPLHNPRCLIKYIHEIAEKTPQIYFQGSCCASSSQIKTSTTLMRQSKPWECHSKSGRLSLYHEWRWLAAITTTEFISFRLWANSDTKNLHSELLWHFQEQWEEGSVTTLASTQDFGQNLKELQLPCFTTQDTKPVKFWRSFDGSAALAKTNQDTDPWIQIYLRVMGESSVRTSWMW